MDNAGVFCLPAADMAVCAPAQPLMGPGFRRLIEQAMYFALGFLVAGLFTLMFLPAFWRRALRLSMRRLQMLAPMSMEEVVAERDLLRADFAVRENRLEKEIEAVKALRAQDLAAVGRHAARVAELDAQLKRAEADRLELEARLREQVKIVNERTELMSATEMALHEMTERAERNVETLRLLESDRDALGRATQEQQSRAATHEANLARLHEQNAQLQQALERLLADFSRVSGQAARAPLLEGDLTRVAAEFEISEMQRRALEADRDATRRTLRETQLRMKNEVEHLENALRVAREEARDHADKLETARADNAMLAGAVEALRANLRRAGAARAGLSVVPPPASDAEIAALREAIIAFGDRIVAKDNCEEQEARRA